MLIATDTMTGGRVRRLQELAADLGESSRTHSRATKEANLLAARQSAMHTDTMTGGRVRRLQELAADLGESSRAHSRAADSVKARAHSRATKEANLLAARQSAMHTDSSHSGSASTLAG